MAPSLCLLLVLSLASQRPPQIPPRDTPRADAGAGTAVVRGRVVDKESGAPIPRAIVVLVRMSGTDAPHRRYARTVEDGRFEFEGVVAGSYHLGADTGDERPTHLPLLAGVAEPSQRNALTPPNTIEIGEGEVRENVNLALSRALAIAGAVLNDHGDPLAGVEVRAELIRGGRVIRRSPVRRTDDRGEFRLFGLPHGRYRVCALAPPPYLRTPLFPERLMTTCYPSATREQDAAPIVLRSGEEPQVQIRMQLARLFTLSGTVLNAAGAPAAGASIHVSTRNRLDVFGMTYNADANGRFRVLHLVAGDYDVEAYIPDPNQPSNPRIEFAAENVIVSGDADLVLSMSRTARVAGHIVFDGAPGQVPAPDQLSVVAIGGPRAPRPGAPRVHGDLTFVLDGLFGPQLLDVVGAPAGWVLKGVRYAGGDVTDTPTEFRTSGDPRHLELTLTRRSAAAMGTVVGPAGEPQGGTHVFLFPAEPQRWGRGGRNPMTPSSEAGAFAFHDLRPGEYVIVALRQEDAPEQPERDDYELLSRIGERLVVAEGETRTLTVRLASLPEERGRKRPGLKDPADMESVIGPSVYPSFGPSSRTGTAARAECRGGPRTSSSNARSSGS